MKKFSFIPELELDLSQAPKDVAIKGQSPRLDYGFTLPQLYPTVPALDAHHAYQQIRDEFAGLNDLLFNKLKLRGSSCLPPVTDNAQASYLLGILFDPTTYYTGGIWQRLAPSISAPTSLLLVEEARPFPLRIASPQKLIHTLMWIDTNIKVIVEGLTEAHALPATAVRQIVESALKIYSYLVKHDDYYLARSINFNYSMFLQDRILNLIFGDTLYRNIDQLQEQGELANHIVLQLLKDLGELSYRQLCTLGVFMGVIWTGNRGVHQSFQANPSAVLGSIDGQLSELQANWCIEHIEQFLTDMGTGSPKNVTVILDDNGESVFDIALFQRLLIDNADLNVIFIVNRYPVSNNIALGTFQALLQDAYFADLRRLVEQNRALLCIEEQVFRSFELAYLQDQTRRVIYDSQVTYIKGVNFFETLQIPDIARYHSFTVHGHTSMTLTGCTEGKGVFVKLLPNQAGYVYHSHDSVVTLRNILAATEREI